jgi:hypothetical protein
MFRYECHIVTEQLEHLAVAIILIYDHSVPKSLKKLAIACARISRKNAKRGRIGDSLGARCGDLWRGFCPPEACGSIGRNSDVQQKFQHPE